MGAVWRSTRLERLALAGVGLLVALAGCSLVIGVGGISGGGDAGDEGDAGGGGCDCLPPVPPGWSVVALSAATTDPCPDGYGDASDLVVDPMLGPASCACICTVTTPPTCTSGTVVEGYSYGTTCADASANQLQANDGGCTDYSFSGLAPLHDIQGPSPSGGACSAEKSRTLPAGGSAGRACAAQAGTLSGCAAGGTCAQAVAAPFEVCIAQPGAVACPQGFARAHSAGASLADTRDCTDCTCGAPTATCDGTLSWYADAGCANLLATAPADDACHPTASAGVVAASYQYAATPQGVTCTPGSPSTPTGDASLVSPTTICCR